MAVKLIHAAPYLIVGIGIERKVFIVNIQCHRTVNVGQCGTKVRQSLCMAVAAVLVEYRLVAAQVSYRLPFLHYILYQRLVSKRSYPEGCLAASGENFV